MKIYVASSWRNTYYPQVVETLRQAGYEVYDFRNPPTGEGFKWSYIGEDWLEWTPDQYCDKLNTHPLAQQQFKNDLEARLSCDACVLVLPCGRSAHTEAGWFAGSGKPVVAYIPERVEPELMYKLFAGIATTPTEMLQLLKETTD